MQNAVSVFRKKVTFVTLMSYLCHHKISIANFQFKEPNYKRYHGARISSKLIGYRKGWTNPEELKSCPPIKGQDLSNSNILKPDIWPKLIKCDLVTCYGIIWHKGDIVIDSLIRFMSRGGCQESWSFFTDPCFNRTCVDLSRGCMSQCHNDAFDIDLVTSEHLYRFFSAIISTQINDKKGWTRS